MSSKIPCVMVAASQAAGGIAGQFLGPMAYGGGSDWKSILSSHGAGFVVGVLVNYLALTYAPSMLTPGDAIRQYQDPVYTLKSLVHISTGIGVAVDQGFQWLASIIVLALMRMNARTFLLDMAASTVGQGIGGIGAAVVIQRKHPSHVAKIKQTPGNYAGNDTIHVTKVTNQRGGTGNRQAEGALQRAVNPPNS